MCYKRIDIDETRQQKFGYPEGGFPVPRIRNILNEFSGGEVDCHWHTEFQFGLVLNGRLDYNIFCDSASMIKDSLKTGDGFFINSKVLHSYRQLTPGAELFIFSVSPGFFSSSLVFGNIYKKIILPILHSSVFGLFFKQEDKKSRTILDLFQDFHALDPQDTDYELHGLELLCRIWRSLFHEFRTIQKILPARRSFLLREQRMQQMVDFIHGHYPEPLTVEMIAKAGNTSKRECFRCFRDFLSQTPTEYLNQYRLSAAAYMLLNSAQSISSICEQCGFNNVSYFGKLFRRSYGTTPNRYRLTAR